MDNHSNIVVISKSYFRHKHNFLIFFTASIIIAIITVTISMLLYNGSGAAQLDLSRPGYVGVRSQATTNKNDFDTFLSVGEINITVINDFNKLYNQQAQKIKAVDAFGGDPLSPDSLGIGQ